MPPRKQASKGKGVAPNDTSKLFPDAPPLPKLTDKNKIVKDKGSRSTLGDHREGQAQIRAVQNRLLVEHGEQKGQAEATLAFLEKTVKDLDNASVPINDLKEIFKLLPKEAEVPDNNAELLNAVSEALEEVKLSSSNNFSAESLQRMANSGDEMLSRIREFGEAIAEQTIQEHRLRADKLALENKLLKQQLAATNEHLVKFLHGSNRDEKTVREDPEIVQKLVTEIQHSQAELRGQIADAKDQLETARAQQRHDQEKIKALERAIKKRDTDIAMLENKANFQRQINDDANKSKARKDLKMAELQEQLEGKEERMTDREAHISSLEKEVAFLKDEMQRQSEQHVKNMDELRKDQQSQIQELQMEEFEREGLEIKIDRILSENYDLEDTERSLESTQGSLSSQLKEAHLSIESLKKDKVDLTEAMARGSVSGERSRGRLVSALFACCIEGFNIIRRWNYY